MRKILLSIIIITTLKLQLQAQTLFTYGNQAVDAKEFLKAFAKNNTGPAKNKAAAIKSYLELYIKSRLKIHEAYQRGYDTLSYLKAELAELRNQLSENYMTDPTLIDRLVKEAFQRSQKDIRAAHIFISFKDSKGFMDSTGASRKAHEVYARLLRGENFARLAAQYSDDTSARTNGGEIGYITVFTLPYEFESAIYNTPPGKISPLIKSGSGYHIFKNLGERKAAGKIKVQQILIAIPPHADEAEKKKLAAQADSLYKRVLAGDNFNRLAADFSNDYVTAVVGGMMPEISVGQYDPVFEKAIWSLSKDGAVSKPFQTSHGWHIVKRVSLKPVISDPANKEYMQELKYKVMNDSRSKNSKDFIYKQVTEKKGFRKFDYDDEALWNMSDSILDKKPMTTGWAITAYTPLFAIGDSVYNANHWVNYAYMHRFQKDRSGPKPWPQLREEWINSLLEEYYRNHLEEFNEEFRNQIKELQEGTLFFEIMQREVWNKAQTDTAGQLAIYEKNKSKYLWKQSADAVLFFCNDINIAKEFHEKLKTKPSDWRNLIETYSDKIFADSSRYEWDQIPNLNKMIPVPGMLTSPLVNNIDNTASFAYIIRVYHKPMQRSFQEAKGLVISDYQLQLEKEWEEELTRKYPVSVNTKVLEDISK